MNISSDERLQWLRFVLNPSLPIPVVMDWQRLLDFSYQQAITGIINPGQFKEIRPDSESLYEWISQELELRALNDLLNRRVVELVGLLNDAGFRCCILKGQGNGLMYTDADLRVPGDIDVWVDADKEIVYEYVKKLFPQAKEQFKHIKFPLFQDVEVDIHYTPLKFYNPLSNRRLQKWMSENKDAQMTNFVRLAGTNSDIAIPLADFNAVYQLGHIMIHVEDQGIGLRQMIDYYYVLKTLNKKNENQLEYIKKTWERLGMIRMAAAVMWVEHEVLGLQDEYLLTPPNERLGRLIAKDMLEGGNFGHYSSISSNQNLGRWRRKCSKALRIIRLAPCFPGEVVFNIISRISA